MVQQLATHHQALWDGVRGGDFAISAGAAQSHAAFSILAIDFREIPGECRLGLRKALPPEPPFLV